MTTIIYLSDVTECDGPTMIVPRTETDHIAFSINRTAPGELRDLEVPVRGPAGTLLIYTTDVFHRGSAMTGHPRSRFAFLVDFMARGAEWMGRRAWPDTAGRRPWHAILGRATPRERELYGFPSVWSDYWNDQTLRDVAVRWPDVDMTPYQDAWAATSG